jgi:NDP-sugar pyrophosphorylase family protein
VRFSHEEVILGTAGGIRRAAPLLRGDGPVVVCNADFLSDVDLEAALAAHATSGAAATLVLAPARPGFSVVETDARGRVLSLAGEPAVERGLVAGTWLFTGCQIVSDEVFDRIPERTPSDIVRDVYRGMCRDGRIASYIHHGFFWEFGSLDSYLDGSLALLGCTSDRLREIAGNHDVVRRIDGAVAAVGPGAEIEGGARLLGRTALGYASHVSAGAAIEDSVVMPEAWIGPDCRLRRCIVGHGVELSAGFVAHDLAISADPGDGTVLPSDVERLGGLLVRSLATPARA